MSDSEPVATGRGRTIKVRVSDAEHVALRARCPRPRLAEWMRETCLGVEPSRASREAPPATDPALLRQLAGAGNLLNQIARAVHRGDWKAADRVQVLARLAAAERELQAVRDAASRDPETGSG